MLHVRALRHHAVRRARQARLRRRPLRLQRRLVRVLLRGRRGLCRGHHPPPGRSHPVLGGPFFLLRAVLESLKDPPRLACWLISNDKSPISERRSFNGDASPSLFYLQTPGAYPDCEGGRGSVTYRNAHFIFNLCFFLEGYIFVNWVFSRKTA